MLLVLEMPDMLLARGWSVPVVADAVGLLCKSDASKAKKLLSTLGAGLASARQAAEAAEAAAAAAAATPPSKRARSGTSSGSSASSSSSKQPGKQKGAKGVLLKAFSGAAGLLRFTFPNGVSDL